MTPKIQIVWRPYKTRGKANRVDATVNGDWVGCVLQVSIVPDGGRRPQQVWIWLAKVGRRREMNSRRLENGQYETKEQAKRAAATYIRKEIRSMAADPEDDRPQQGWKPAEDPQPSRATLTTAGSGSVSPSRRGK